MNIEIFGSLINWPSQLVGLIGTIIQIVSYFQKDKKKFFLLGCFGCFFTTIEPLFILLGGTNSWAAIFANGISMVRNILIYISLSRRNKELPWWAGLLTCAILWACCIPFFNEWYSYLLPVFVTIVTVAMLFKNYVIVKTGVIISEIGFALYGLMIASYIGFVRDSILTISAIVSLIIYLATKKKEEKQKQAVIEPIGCQTVVTIGEVNKK